MGLQPHCLTRSWQGMLGRYDRDINLFHLPYMRSSRRYSRRQMQENRIIHIYQSPWASPNGTLRFCVNYRRFNSLIYPLPRIEHFLTTLGCAWYFSNPGFGQWILASTYVPRKSKVESFCYPQMLIWVPLNALFVELNNALATFQWLMELCLGDLNQECLLIYLDNIIIIFSSIFEEHLRRVE